MTRVWVMWTIVWVVWVTLTQTIVCVTSTPSWALFKLKIFCELGGGNTDDIRVGQCPSQTISELKFLWGGDVQVRQTRIDIRTLIPGQTNISSLPRLVNMWLEEQRKCVWSETIQNWIRPWVERCRAQLSTFANVWIASNMIHASGD